ncbi:MAG: PIG-L family deacetylase [Dehalococcoidia bacterium]|nr:PIG-L family deacetylase [Dehalococcoidia bacterium]
MLRQPLRILAIGAHCDDIEIGLGGTLLELARSEDVEVDWFVLTSTPERAQETLASADSFLGRHGGQYGSDRVRIHDFRDGFLPYQGIEVKEAFEALKAHVQPDVIFTHSRDDSHQDHRFVAELTWNTWRNHLIFEYEIPKYDGDLGPMSAYVEVSEEHVREKWELLRRHYPSQHSRQWFTEDTFRGLMRLRGVEANAPSGYAEAFRARKLLMDLVPRSSSSEAGIPVFAGVSEGLSR